MRYLPKLVMRGLPSPSSAVQTARRTSAPRHASCRLATPLLSVLAPRPSRCPLNADLALRPKFLTPHQANNHFHRIPPSSRLPPSNEPAYAAAGS